MVAMSRPTALIAEDHREWQRTLTQILEQEYDIGAVVADGNQALDTARVLRPDVITLDVSLPGRSGLLLLPALRAALPEATIIIVTTHTSKLYVDEAYQRGADGYVAKRDVLTELLPTIAAATTRIVGKQQSRA
jgi:DNA-binding NarL/FixJ family response regulator